MTQNKGEKKLMILQWCMHAYLVLWVYIICTAVQTCRSYKFSFSWAAVAHSQPALLLHHHTEATLEGISLNNSISYNIIQMAQFLRILLLTIIGAYTCAALTEMPAPGDAKRCGDHLKVIGQVSFLTESPWLAVYTKTGQMECTMLKESTMTTPSTREVATTLGQSTTGKQAIGCWTLTMWVRNGVEPWPSKKPSLHQMCEAVKRKRNLLWTPILVHS